MVRKHKHDMYLELLCEKLKDEYDSLFVNIPLFSKKNRRIAEIDILAWKDGQCDVYEVKCSYRVTKAKKQLRRIKRLIPRVRNMFFFCGESRLLEEIV
ncbi:TPA: hypothetical protein HA245_03875 [Candidatus Woesearchaeota archaeon]|nr:hypothetical protein [Candidatus Woesearchaeota archaeon]HIH48570.1 hypothetical protein [Candidatus Woesearchaeota archaeon]HIJ04249.1 hypothetical protein [Candidatus Woesearchaeota archaeon]